MDQYSIDVKVKKLLSWFFLALAQTIHRVRLPEDVTSPSPGYSQNRPNLNNSSGSNILAHFIIFSANLLPFHRQTIKEI